MVACLLEDVVHFAFVWSRNLENRVDFELVARMRRRMCRLDISTPNQ